MKLVVDANILISALIRDGASREIIFANEFNLVCPEYLSEELEKYKILIANKSGLTAEEVSLMIALLFKRIRIIPSADYQTKMLEAESLMDIVNFRLISTGGTSRMSLSSLPLS